MLLFSVSCDLYGEAKKKLEEELERYTGEKCIVLTMCTGVFRIPGPIESGSGEEGANKSCELNEDRDCRQ